MSSSLWWEGRWVQNTSWLHGSLLSWNFLREIYKYVWEGVFLLMIMGVSVYILEYSCILQGGSSICKSSHFKNRISVQIQCHLKLMDDWSLQKKWRNWRRRKMYLSRHVILKQEIEPYPIMIGACAAHTTKTTTKKVKTPVAVANGGHSSSLWYN